MKFVRPISLTLAFLVAPFIGASAPADIEQAYKTEKAKVDQQTKEQKALLDTKTTEKKAKLDDTAKDKKAKALESKEKKTEAAKAKAEKAKAAKAAKAEKTARTTKLGKTPKTAKVAPMPKKAKTIKTTKVTKTTKLDKKPVAAKEVQKDAAPVVAATHKADIKTLEPMTVIKGEEFTIKRPSSPNFGRTWKLHKALPLQIEQVGKETFVPAEHPGKNEGSAVFTFKGVKAGTTQLEFEKVYPPELRDKKPLKVRIIPVNIKE